LSPPHHLSNIVLQGHQGSMSDGAEEEGSLFSTAFEVGLDGSYRRVETDAAGTSTRSRVGKGAEREEIEQLLRLA
jgi:hypothetical protein